MLARCVATLKPPPELTLSQWADRYRMLSAESSAEPGRWHTDKAPYQREIMDAIGDAHIRRVVIMCAAQLGKTELLLNILGYFMAYAPAPILVMQPTLDMGQTFSKDRLAPMIRDTPVLRGLVDVKSRYAGNTILKKNFPGGHITIVGANSATGLASRPIKVLLADEVDRYPGSAGTEGDPLSLPMRGLHPRTPVLFSSCWNTTLCSAGKGKHRAALFPSCCWLSGARRPRFPLDPFPRHFFRGA